MSAPDPLSTTPSLTGWRRWVFPAVAMVLLPLLSLVGVEMALRLAGVGFDPRFFVETEAGGEGDVTTNPRFGERFFPAAVARSPVRSRLAADKPDGIYRMFVLGGSAALGTPDAAFGFGRILEAMLAESFPERRFEVVGAAMTAVNSHVMRLVADEAADLEPDAFLVYLGNNEVVGPYGPGTLFGAFREGLGWTRASIALKGTRLGQTLGRLATRGGGMELDRWRGMEMFEERRVPADDPRLPAVYEQFRANLEAIARDAEGAGALTLLSTVAVNLRDQPPFASEAADGAESAAALYRAGREALERGDETEADALFARARDADALRFRADAGIDRVIRQVAADGEGIVLVDGAAAVAEVEAVGTDGFWEHVHLDFDGNYRLARAFYDALAPRLTSEPAPAPPDRERCAELLAYTPWDAARSAEEIFGMIRRPPFTGNEGHDERVTAFRRRLAGMRLAAHRDRQAAEAADARALRRRPDDPALIEQHARVLEALGRPAEAATEWRRLVERFPEADAWRTAHAFALREAGNAASAEAELRRVLEHRPGAAARANLAGLLAETGRTDDAEDAYRRALREAPSHEPARVGLARLLEAGDRPEAALELLEEGVAQSPDSPRLQAALAELLDRRGELERALAGYRRALEADPEDAVTHNNLGYALERLGRPDAAEAAYRAAVARDPSFALPHFNLADLALARGDAAEAARRYRFGLTLDPNNRQARANLALALRPQD